MRGLEWHDYNYRLESTVGSGVGLPGFDAELGASSPLGLRGKGAGTAPRCPGDGVRKAEPRRKRLRQDDAPALRRLFEVPNGRPRGWGVPGSGLSPATGGRGGGRGSVRAAAAAAEEEEPPPLLLQPGRRRCGRRARRRPAGMRLAL